MGHCGWTKSQISKPIKVNGFVLKVIAFDPMFQENIRDKVKEYGTLFHFSPQYNEQTILSNGLIYNHNPKNNGIYVLYSIDLSKTPDNVKFFYDPHFQHGVFTQDAIPSNAIQKRQTINIREIFNVNKQNNGK